MPNSTTTRKTAKPSKPHADFPLFPHATGRWAKKVKGKLHYFGKIADDPAGKEALVRWLEQRDDLLAGKTPRAKVEGFTVQNLVNAFLADKRHLLDTREIGLRHFSEIFNTCQKVGDAFGWTRLVSDIAPDDFGRLRKKVAEQWGPIGLGNEIQRVRSVFKFGRESGLCAEPIYGPSFKKPSRKVLRIERAKKGPRMLEADDLTRVLAKLGVPLKAMVLLGVNCGFGNADVASLPMIALNLTSGWVDYPRPKTGIARRCPLWPETIIALQQALAQRPTPNDAAHRDLVFLTRFGRPWRTCELREEGDKAASSPKLRQDDAVAKEFVKVLKALGLHRRGLGFYLLRHTFETIGGNSGDQVAVDAIMGHSREDMATRYREGVRDERLKRVTDHVHAWLFPKEQRFGETLPITS